jgi:hypothetical protein
MNGGTLELSMDRQADSLWAAGSDHSPHSLSMKEIVTVPCVQAKGKAFTDSAVVVLSSSTPGTEIYYTIGGETPDEHARKYSAPIILTQTSAIKALARSASGMSSRIASAEFVKTVPIGTVRLNTQYSPQYPGGGDNALIDGLRGSLDFRLGAWQGYEQNDLDAILDLGKTTTVSRIALSCLQDNNSWIFFPARVEFSFSDDGKAFTDSHLVQNDVSPRDSAVSMKEFGSEIKNVHARYVRVQARNIGTCPPWHKGAGGKAWLFADEIVVDSR